MVNTFRERLLNSTALNSLGNFDFSSLFVKETVDEIVMNEIEESREMKSLKNSLDIFEEMFSWSDDIPEEIIHVSHKGSMKWKVRKNWWTGFLPRLHLVSTEFGGFILNKEGSRVVNYYF